MDPVILFAEPDAVEAAVRDVLRKAGPRGHILNLGHGVVVGAVPPAVHFLFATASASDLFAKAPARIKQKKFLDTCSAWIAGTPEESVAHMFQLSKDIKL